MRSSVAALALLLALGCGPVPGGTLAGSVTPIPADWSGALGGDRAFCEIESRPADPHSIQLECFLHDGQLFAQSHRWALAPWWPTQSWASIWLQHPDVRVRIGEQLFELRAVEVTEPGLRETILRQRGYETPPDGIVLFRFEPRPGPS